MDRKDEQGSFCIQAACASVFMWLNIGQAQANKRGRFSQRFVSNNIVVGKLRWLSGSLIHHYTWRAVSNKSVQILPRRRVSTNTAHAAHEERHIVLLWVDDK